MFKLIGSAIKGAKNLITNSFGKAGQGAKTAADEGMQAVKGKMPDGSDMGMFERVGHVGKSLGGVGAGVTGVAVPGAIGYGGYQLATDPDALGELAGNVGAGAAGATVDTLLEFKFGMIEGISERLGIENDELAGYYGVAGDFFGELIEAFIGLLNGEGWNFNMDVDVRDSIVQHQDQFWDNLLNAAEEYGHDVDPEKMLKGINEMEAAGVEIPQKQQLIDALNEKAELSESMQATVDRLEAMGATEANEAVQAGFEFNNVRLAGAEATQAHPDAQGPSVSASAEFDGAEADEVWRFENDYAHGAAVTGHGVATGLAETVDFVGAGLQGLGRWIYDKSQLDQVVGAEYEGNAFTDGYDSWGAKLQGAFENVAGKPDLDGGYEWMHGGGRLGGYVASGGLAGAARGLTAGVARTGLTATANTGGAAGVAAEATKALTEDEPSIGAPTT